MTPLADDTVEENLRRIQLEVLAAARSYLPDFMQPFVTSMLNSVHAADVVVDRFVTFADSFRYNPPSGFMDVLRRYQQAIRPIESVVIEVEGDVPVTHPTQPSVFPRPESNDVNRIPRPGTRFDPASGAVQPWRNMDFQNRYA